MMRIRNQRLGGLMLGCLLVFVLAAGGLGMRAKGWGARESKAAISADQLIACVRTAVASKPGNVRAVEAESEGDKVLCEVEILAQDGKTYEIEVDVATNAVTEVEEDND